MTSLPRPPLPPLRPWPLRRRHVLQAAAVLAAVPFLASRGASAFPVKPLRIVPFGAAGGPIDTIARAYAEKLRKLWGQPVLVEARPGASGTLAAAYVAKAQPDGHTLLFTLPLSHINAAILEPRLPYDPVRDFAPLSMLATGNVLLVALADAPYANLKEFVAYAKAHPGMAYGSWGIGSAAHLYGELLRRQAGIDTVHVPYQGENALYNDLFGGRLAVRWSNPGSALAQLQAGKIKVLGATGARRMSLFPQVPTFGEQGFSGFDIESWLGAYTTGRTPEPVVELLSSTLREITRQSDIAALLLERGLEPLASSREAFAAQYAADLPRVTQLIKAAGVTAE